MRNRRTDWWRWAEWAVVGAFCLIAGAVMYEAFAWRWFVR